MDPLSAADVFWSALVLAGVAAEVLQRLARRSRGRRSAVGTATGTATGDGASPAVPGSREPASADSR